MNKFEKILSAIDDDEDEPPTSFFGNVFGHLLKEKQKEVVNAESQAQNKMEQLLSSNNTVTRNIDSSTTTASSSSIVVTSTYLSSSNIGSSSNNVSVPNAYDQQVYFPSCPPLVMIEEKWQVYWLKFINMTSPEEILTNFNKNDVPGWLYVQKVFKRMNVLHPIYENQLQQLVQKGKMSWDIDDNNNSAQISFSSIFCTVLRKGYQIYKHSQILSQKSQPPQIQPQPQLQPPVLLQCFQSFLNDHLRIIKYLPFLM